MEDGHLETAEFQDDWEILIHCSDSLVETLHEESMGDEAGGMIKADYFTAQGSGLLHHSGDISDSGNSVGSDKPSWIDPGSDNGRFGNGSAEPWSEDSGSDDIFEDRRFEEFEGKKVDEAKGEMSLYESVQSEIRKFGDEARMDRCLDGDGGKIEGDDDVVRMKVDEEEAKYGGADDEESRRGRVVWWKGPLELVRYCLMRMSNPVWTFSVAAAIMGVVILGRKLYRMRQKTRALQLKVMVDDKKVSQFTSRAARLNEAFSVVRRVPIIRPVLPAPGVTPWPVMSMR